MITSPFPAYIGFAVKTPSTLGQFSLSAAEKCILSPRAVEARKKEFVLGRAACYQALKEIGFIHPPPVLKGAYNEPIWPRGCRGSLTHAQDIAVCAISPDDRINGIGIDLEKITGKRDDLFADAFGVVAAGSELEWILSDPARSLLRAKMIFSAKEAAFKAYFPHVLRYIDFKDAVLMWDEDQKRFTGRLLIDIDRTYGLRETFYVNCRRLDQFIFCDVLLPL